MGASFDPPVGRSKVNIIKRSSVPNEMEYSLFVT